MLVQDESIFIHDSVMTKRRKWIIKEKRPVVTVTGSHSKTIVFGVLSLDGKQLFRQYERFDSHSFIAYLEEARKKFKKFIMFVDRATQHRSQDSKGILAKEFGNDKNRIFSCGFARVKCCRRMLETGKVQHTVKILLHSLSHLKQIISNYYRTRRFNLDIKKYLFRSTN